MPGIKTQVPSPGRAKLGLVGVVHSDESCSETLGSSSGDPKEVGSSSGDPSDPADPATSWLVWEHKHTKKKSCQCHCQGTKLFTAWQVISLGVKRDWQHLDFKVSMKWRRLARGTFKKQNPQWEKKKKDAKKTLGNKWGTQCFANPCFNAIMCTSTQYCKTVHHVHIAMQVTHAHNGTFTCTTQCIHKA